MESKTNIVLVHGAWADGSSWGKVIPFLQQKGFNVAAAQIPLTSLADDIVVTRNLLAAQKGPTVLADVQMPLSINSFIAKSGPTAWKHLPSWYMVATEDQMIPPQAEEFMAKRMGATVRKVAASHAAMVSHPREVAELIMLAAQSI